MRHKAGVHREPLRTPLELVSERRLGVGLAGEPLVAQMPALLLLLATRRVYLSLWD
jgi:hypothetical protein